MTTHNFEYSKSSKGGSLNRRNIRKKKSKSSKKEKNKESTGRKFNDQEHLERQKVKCQRTDEELHAGDFLEDRSVRSDLSRESAISAISGQQRQQRK